MATTSANGPKNFGIIHAESRFQWNNNRYQSSLKKKKKKDNVSFIDYALWREKYGSDPAYNVFKYAFFSRNRLKFYWFSITYYQLRIAINNAQ